MKDFHNYHSETIIILDNQNKIVGVNSAGEQLLQMKEADLLGKSADLLFPCQSTKAYREETLQEGRKEVNLSLDTGLAIYVELTVSSFMGTDGTSPMRILTIRDFQNAQESAMQRQQRDVLKKQNAILQALQETTLDLHSSLNLDDVLQNILRRACNLLETKHGYLDILLDTGELETIISTGALEETHNDKITKGTGVTGSIWETMEHLVIDDYDSWSGRKPNVRHGLISAVMGMPLILKQQLVGVIVIARNHQSNLSFSEDDISVLSRFADLAVVALHNAKLYGKAQDEIQFRRNTEMQLRNTSQLLQLRIEQIELMQEQMQELAIRDPLTELYNRRYLKDTLELEIANPERASKSLAILMMDSDHLKGINDKYGHKAGDDFLIKISNVLKENIRTSDIACRYGGDEFVVVMSDVKSEDAYQRAEGLRQNITCQHIVHRNKAVTLSVSIGIAMYPKHGSTADSLLQKADQALYEAKRKGKNCVVLYKNEQEIKI